MTSLDQPDGSVQTHYGVPALLSFVFPGLGQLVKKQTGLAVTIWILIAVPSLVASLGVSLLGPRTHLDPALAVVALVASAVLYLFAGGVWIWGVVDAYNRPAN